MTFRRIHSALVRLTSPLLIGTLLLASASSAGHAVASGRAAASTTLTIMNWDATMSPTSAAWTTIVKGFEAQHPGVTIKTNYVAFAQYLPTLTSMAAAKSLPDIFFAHVEAAVLGRAGVTVNFKDYLPASFFKPFYGGPLNQFNFDGGKIYALPQSAQIFGLFVNTPVMQKLGLAVPQTWSQLMSEAPKLLAAGYTPLAFGDQAGNVCPDFFLPLVTQEGGNVNALDDLTKPGLSWNSTPITKALALLKSMVAAKLFEPGINGLSELQGQQYAWHGKSAMLFTGSWMPPTIAQQAPKSYTSTYTIAKLPTVNPGERHWSGDGSGQGWAVNASSANKALAIDFIKYYFSAPVYSAYIKATQEFPAMQSALSQVTDPKVKQMVGWVAAGDGSDHILFGSGSWNAVSNACTAILGGSSASPESLAAQIQAQVMKTRKH